MEWYTCTIEVRMPYGLGVRVSSPVRKFLAKFSKNKVKAKIKDRNFLPILIAILMFVIICN